MDHSETIHRLGHWIASHQAGVLRLAWPQGELFLTIRDGKIVSAVGPDGQRLARVLGTRTGDEKDLMLAAREASEKHNIPIDEAVGAVKVLLQQELGSWLTNPDRELKLLDEQPEVGPDPNISFQHALIELILTADEDIFSTHILPDKSTILKRNEHFSDHYSSLRLSEEADLVVARIDGQRKISDILSKSSLAGAEILRLLSALTAAGLLEMVADPPGALEEEIKEPELSVTLMDDNSEKETQPQGHHLSPWVIVGAGVGSLLLISLVWFFFLRPSPPLESTEANGHWGLVVDLACEPAEYRRMIRKADSRADVQAIESAGDSSSDQPCWQLVWGDFPSKGRARDSINDIPKILRHEGFQAHPIELSVSPSIVDNN